LILIVLGVLALLVRSVTYFTTDQVTGPLGFFAWEVERPHTIFINPLAGMVAVAVGIALVLMARSKGVSLWVAVRSASKGLVGATPCLRWGLRSLENGACSLARGQNLLSFRPFYDMITCTRTRNRPQPHLWAVSPALQLTANS
jgi:hypothetical protein